jgi:group I intron endonuclease
MRKRYEKYKHPMLGKHHTPKSKNKISLATRGYNNPMYGKKHTLETKYLISLALSKPVYMYKVIGEEVELKYIYLNSVKVAEFLGLNKTTIGRCIK